MIRRPPRSTPKPSSAASDVYKRQFFTRILRYLLRSCLTFIYCIFLCDSTSCLKLQPRGLRVSNTYSLPSRFSKEGLSRSNRTIPMLYSFLHEIGGTISCGSRPCDLQTWDFFSSHGCHISCSWTMTGSSIQISKRYASRPGRYVLSGPVIGGKSESFPQLFYLLASRTPSPSLHYPITPPLLQ